MAKPLPGAFPDFQPHLSPARQSRRTTDNALHQPGATIYREYAQTYSFKNNRIGDKSPCFCATP
jgi:hypothetical protein